MDSAVSKFRTTIGEAAWNRLLSRLHELNSHIVTRGIRPFESRADLLTGYAYDEFYDWDLYFENIYLSYYGCARFCRTNLEKFLDRQHPCGFVSRTLIAPRHRQHFKPFLAQIALLGARQGLGFSWLKGRYYDRLVKYLDHWFWFCDFDRNGLCVWDSADHSGMDNQVSRCGEISSMTVEGVDLNCYLARELQALACIARELGLSADADAHAARAQRLWALINAVFWDEKEGFYFDRDERTGGLVKVKSIAGLLPLWLGTVPPERARRLVYDHLRNPAEFWLPYPIATYAQTEPDYVQQRLRDENNCNWRGPVWVPTNYMIFHGLQRQGFIEEARDLAYRTFSMALQEETTREYYNAETGSGFGLNPFWGWSSLAYLMPLEFETGYDPTDIERKTVEPVAAKHLGISFA